MRAFTVLLLSLTSLFAGCASVQPAPPKVLTVCPRIPDLEMDPEAAPPQSYTQMMQKLLSGSLPKLTDFNLSSTPASANTGLRKPP